MVRGTKKKVQDLRKKGYTYGEIRKKFSNEIPKSTISTWCRNVVVSEEGKKRHKKKLKELNKKARKAAIKANKNKQEKFLEKLEKDNKYLKDIMQNKDSAKVALALLYLGEGAKWEGSRQLALGNSDTEILKIYLKLLNICYGINRKNLKARVSYRADQDINELEDFWSSKLGIPKSNFYKTKPDPRTKGKRTKKKNYNGVCVVYGGGTKIQQELDIIARMYLEI